jgi:exo-beta-1,3-glucanase (GH17 family)
VFVYVDENGVPYQTSTGSAALPTEAPATTSEVAQPTSESPPSVEVPATTIVPSPPPPPPPAPVTSDVPSSPAFTPTPEPSSVQVEQNPPNPPPNAPAPAPAPEPEPSQPAPAPSAEAAPAPPAAQSPAPAPESAPAPAPESNPQGNQPTDRLGLGVTYDPFTGGEGSSRCKTDQEMDSEFDKMKSYGSVRIYGMGCNVISTAVRKTVQNNQKLMAGAYMSTRGNGEDLSQVIQALKDAVDEFAGGNWDIVQLFSVENERVNDHDMTASAVVDAINNARGQLRSLGYNGPVGAVETVPATVDNPAICKASDVVMVNCHPFFDPNTKADDAGTFVKGQIEQVKAACDNKRVVITESGWPHQGDANGQAVPSPENQRKALASLRNNFDTDMFIHNAFDSLWKSDWASSFNAERYWGVIQ